MKIAFVHDWMTGFRGGEQVLLVLHKMYPEAPIYTSVYHPDKMPQFAKADVRTSYLQKITKVIKGHEVLIPLMPQAFESFDMREYDVIVSIGNGFAKGVISHPHQRHISYTFTPPRYLWHLGGDQRNKGRVDSGLRHWAEHHLRTWDIVSSARPTEWVTISRATQERIAKIYRKESELIAPPVNTTFFTVNESAARKGYVMASQMVWYKRHDLAIEACIKLNVPLVVIGAGPERERLEKLAEGHKNIVFTGRASTEDLRMHLQQAKGFIFPAEEEFGIAPVEAMACGTPVIALGKGGALDYVRPGISGAFFAEQTVDSLADALTAFESETYKPEAVRAVAEEFSVKRFQDAMQAVILGKND